MSSLNASYFHSASLRRRFLDELDAALLSDDLDAHEHLWLLGLTDPMVDDPDPVRADRLSFDQGSNPPFELCAALLLSHVHAYHPQVYLYSLAKGFEAFSDRQALSAALNARFGQGKASVVFEEERIEGDPFQAQMLAIVDHQVGRLRQLTAQLRLMPSLYQASTASLARQLRTTLAHLSLDAETHLLHLVHDPLHDTEAFPVPQTLAQAGFDECCHVKLAEGLERRFLDAQGLVASAADATLFSQALADAAAGVAAQYAELLSTFWSTPGSEQRTPRDVAVEGFSSSLRDQLYRVCDEDALNAIEAQTLLALLPPLSGEQMNSSTVRCDRLAIKVGDGAAYPLAGTFVVRSRTDQSRAVFWFSPQHRFVKFADMAALAACFATVQGRQQLRPALALADQAVLFKERLNEGLNDGLDEERDEAPWRLELEEILTALPADRIDSILRFQARNLAYAMGLACRPDDMPAMIDDALDIRQLLDPRQVQFSAGRWREEAPFNFSQVWVNPHSGAPVVSLPPAAVEGVTARQQETVEDVDAQAYEDIETGSDIGNPPMPSWLGQSQALDARLERLQRLDIVLLNHAQQALQQYVCVLFSEAVQAPDIRVQWLESLPVDPSDTQTHGVAVSESQQLISKDLLSLLLESVSDRRPGLLQSGAQVLVEAQTLEAPIQAAAINHVLKAATRNFMASYLSHFGRSRTEFQRQEDRQVHPANESLSLRENAMRIDLALARREGQVDAKAFDRVRQVLDRPVRSLRLALGVPVVEAFSVSLVFGGNLPALLCDTMVLRQPLDNLSPVLLWSSARGWRSFPTLAILKETLLRGFAGRDREAWLELLGARDGALLRAHLPKVSADPVQIRLDRVDGHAVQGLQQRALIRGQQDVKQLCQRAVRCRLEAGLFGRLAAAVEQDQPLIRLLDGLSVRLESSVFEALLPPWVTSASINDLLRYNDIWKRYYLASDGGEDFLFGVASLQEYSRQRLVAQLNLDFPDQQFDPDQITVTSRRYVSAFPSAGQLPSAIPAASVINSESLTRFAINRFVDHPGAVLSVHSRQRPQVTRLLTAGHLRQLVRGLDVGAGYRALLGKTLAPDDAQYALRNRVFVRQLPLIMLASALTEKLRGHLSAQAFEFISSLAEMPDGIARETVDGIKVILSPLQLVADAGMNPDTVAGMYLICPADPDTGPVVLYAIYNASFTFREYASQTALMDAVRADESMQQLLLERVDPEIHRRYAHGGFAEPHLPFSVEGLFDAPLRGPGPVTLALAEVKDNALHYLFNGAIKVLLDMGVANSVSNQQADRAERIFLMTLGVEQALTLLPGKLAALVTLWQSQTLFRASAVSASGQRWGEALSEFSSALGVMVAGRRQSIEDQAYTEPPDQEEGLSAGSTARSAEKGSPASVFSWRNASLDAELQMRLREFEATGVALNAMRHDDLLNLYHDKSNDTPYAVVEGKVYQVRALDAQGQWTIVKADGVTGPRLRLDSHQRWHLDVSLQLKGGGGAVGKLKTVNADFSAEAVLVIEARGMPEIRLLYRDRARRIGQAHLQAKRYLENCLDNLGVAPGGAGPDPRVMRLIADFFGTVTPDKAMLAEVESATRTLFSTVMDPSLAPFSSPRFVVGSNRSGKEAVTAFVVRRDPQKRIFLTERFFNVPSFDLKPEAAAEGFDAAVHYRAANLIHELSHVALNTTDIAYLDSMAPYPDLLRVNNAGNIRLRAHVERLHDFRLSHRTVKADLFTLSDDGLRRDIKAGDGRGFSAIARIASTTDLNEARDLFLTDEHVRSKIMLNNADSLTLLLLRLGRVNYVVPSP